jgi:hypothetical protein
MMQDKLSDKARAFLARKPTLVGRVLGCNVYEHPTLGDESPLYMVTSEGQLRILAFYELPSEDELSRELSRV